MTISPSNDFKYMLSFERYPLISQTVLDTTGMNGLSYITGTSVICMDFLKDITGLSSKLRDNLWDIIGPIYLSRDHL